MKKLSKIPTRAEIKEAHLNIAPYIHRTDVLQCQALNTLTGCKIYLKCENFQKVGAFKMRGASCAALSLTSEEKALGIATHSSGNHAQAVALTAKLMGIPAHIVMPDNAPTIKREAVQDYGAIIYTSGPKIDDREQMMQKVLKTTGAAFIHPYNDYNIIAGQSTAAKELIEDTDVVLDVIIAPVGGGGLLSGTALSAKYHNPNILVIGAEPKNVDDAYRSLQSGVIEKNDSIDTIADGLRTNLGPKTFDTIRTFADRILTVSESNIIEAMKLIWERVKIVVEPSGAVPLAALLEYPSLFAKKNVGLILSGGNVDLRNLPF